MVFPEVMYGCESWTIKKAERWRIDAFELWCWRRESWTLGDLGLLDYWESLGLQGDPPVHPNGNHTWIFIGRTDVEAETPIFWPLDAKNWHWKRPLCWERLSTGGDGDDRGWDGWMASLTQGTWVWAGSRSWWRTRKPGVWQSMESQRFRRNWANRQ